MNKELTTEEDFIELILKAQEEIKNGEALKGDLDELAESI